MDSKGSATTRRRLLTTAGLAGASALLPAMTGMRPATASAEPPRLQAGAGTGKTVFILGAGIAGLTAAHLLTKAGFDCRILEAQQRAGGRNLTARKGTVVTEHAAAGGFTQQTCGFDDGLYLNLGPGRLPYHHRRILRYCQELGVALEPYTMETTANLVQTPSGFGGKAQVNRRIANDTRGQLAQLLVKAANRGALDAELDKRDRANLLELLRAFGDLKDDHSYRGSTRSGYDREPGVRQPLEAPPPVALKDLLDSGFWRHRFYQPVDHLWQPTMFQPVGGMDKIVEGFTRKVGHLIYFGAEVTQIKLVTDGVEIIGTYAGSPFQVRADYCLSNIPLPVLQKIPANFTPDFTAAVNSSHFEPTCKVGWQANTRFWESDANQIYGGISWINHNITQMWYPSYDYFTAKGTMTGAYNFSKEAIALGDMSLDRRLVTAREGALRLHPEFSDESIVPTSLGMSIAWHKVPFQLGGWADWKDTPADRRTYGRLLAPDGRFHVIGDQVSPLPGWQEGAVMSAEYVTGQVTETESTAIPHIQQAPDSRALTQGQF